MPTTETAPRYVVFDDKVSRRGYRINRFAKSLTSPEGRSAFLADERGAMSRMGMSGAEMDLVQARNWQGLLDRGASIYLLAKIAIVYGGTLNDIGAQLRGQTLPEMMQAIAADRAARLA